MSAEFEMTEEWVSTGSQDNSTFFREVEKLSSIQPEVESTKCAMTDSGKNTSMGLGI